MVEINENIILEDGIEVQDTKSFGIGIDCHAKFIQVSVYVRRQMKFFEYRKEFPTDWDSLVSSKQWTVNVIRSCSDPVPDMDSVPFHYCIESTSTYHMPVLLAWEGMPSVINPTIAGATKRKTDVLDARLLALHDLTGVWPQSYIPSTDVKALRVMISERNRYVRESTSAASRINNIILRFGLTIGSGSSVVKNADIRALIENQVSDQPSEVVVTNICPFSIPTEVRSIVRSEYDKYDHAVECANKMKSKIREKVISKETSSKGEHF